jgi:hypothetical protein
VIIASILAVPYFLRHQISRAINAVRRKRSERGAASPVEDRGAGDSAP